MLDPHGATPPITSELVIVPDATLSFDEVRALPESRFQRTDSMYPGETTPEAYWGRVQIRSAASDPTDWILPFSLDYVKAILVRSDGSRETHQTGTALPLADRTLPLAHPPAIQIRLAPGETATLWLQVRQKRDAYQMVLDVQPVELSAFDESQRKTDLLQASFLGVLLALAFYNLFLYASFLDKSYLYYVLFLLASAIYWATLQGYIIQYFWPEDQMGYLGLNYVGLSLAAVAYTLFVRSFLQTLSLVPRLDRILIGVIVGWSLSLVIALSGFWVLGPTIGAILALIMLSTTFAAGILAARSGFRPARYYLIAAGAFLVIGLVYSLAYLLDPLLQGSGRLILQIGMLTEVLLLAMALSVRIRFLSKSKQEAESAYLSAEANSEAFREASELKTRLLSIAAHDLRSPLTSIVGFAELLHDETPGRADLHEYTEVIQSGAGRMLSLIDDLLVASALDARGIDLRPEPTDLGALAAEVAREYSPRAREKAQVLTVEGTDTGPLASVDQARIRAVLDNLISNAVKYTPHGGRVEVRTEIDMKQARVAVSDTGPGLSADDQAHLFKRFRRLTPVPTGGESSTGLGLSIAKEMARLHGGDIEVDSTLGRGTTFTLAVPLEPVAV